MKLFSSTAPFGSLAGVALVAVTLVAAVNPRLKQVSSVYIFSMSGGMDQYLANQLTSAGVFRVVADPKKADAILTDRLGESFEKKMNELYPPPPTAEQLKKEEEEKDKEKRPGFDMKDGVVGRPTSSFSGARGNYFLVDRGSRAVLWSVYEPPAKDSTPGSMTKIAVRVVKHLEADLSDKKPE
ncbi:MAG TPA: hypothetical protein VKG79_07295 [Bryobacteraceae bacterium]|nr:hypothetical protein [Bryobacteraceae bacterium]